MDSLKQIAARLNNGSPVTTFDPWHGILDHDAPVFARSSGVCLKFDSLITDNIDSYALCFVRDMFALLPGADKQPLCIEGFVVTRSFLHSLWRPSKDELERRFAKKRTMRGANLTLLMPPIYANWSEGRQTEGFTKLAAWAGAIGENYDRVALATPTDLFLFQMAHLWNTLAISVGAHRGPMYRNFGPDRGMRDFPEGAFNLSTDDLLILTNNHPKNFSVANIIRTSLDSAYATEGNHARLAADVTDKLLVDVRREIKFALEQGDRHYTAAIHIGDFGEFFKALARVDQLTATMRSIPRIVAWVNAGREAYDPENYFVTMAKLWAGERCFTLFT